MATLASGYRPSVTINNKAEGSAPLSVAALARQIVDERSDSVTRDEVGGP